MNRIENHPILQSRKDRRQIRFYFDGDEIAGFEGEPVASALIALGHHVFSYHHKDGAPQGLFCANGQCSQCTMLIDGIPKKSCMTPLSEGMDVRTLYGLPHLPAEDEPLVQAERRSARTDIFIIGAGPAGLAAAAELGRMGYQVLVADDKAQAGGKLVLQTHKFFGSEADCYAGTRGIDIAHILEDEAKRHPSVTILTNAPVVGIYKDRKAGIYLNYESYLLVEFTALVVAAGAREKALHFPGWDLPGVIGAGAFQTLVNRDLVKAYRKILIIGSGNVGLIAAYHALQAGITVAGIIEVAGRVNGYQVHADKIRRMGVPISLNSTILKAEGRDKVERAIVAAVDEKGQPVAGTARAYEVDAVLIAAGLSPCNEFLEQARRYGIMAVAAGDAAEIAEASSAMYGGKTAAMDLASMLGKKIIVNPEWEMTRKVLASRPGDSYERSPVVPGSEWRPVFFCSEEIPCNPCATVCPIGAIQLRPMHSNIMDLPYFEGNRCTGCGSCVAVCPGLAITLVRRIPGEKALADKASGDKASGDRAQVVLPWEFNADFDIGTELDLVDQKGDFVERAPVVLKRRVSSRNTWLLTFHVDIAHASKIAGIRVQPQEASAFQSAEIPADGAADTVLCRCERVTLGEIVEFIRNNKVRDINQLKSLRVGMGACGGKTCSQLVGKAFRLAGTDPAEVEPATQRPLFMEMPMGAAVNEGLHKLGGKEAGARGAP
ncbi:MAG: FAD-dependent oxidoreductase [Rectinema subterraneum]|uniref:FAD-dependent oxidoreductase n=1 Tax=Rectinema subterraneum TaxID=2653714 RepID=UPI003C7AD629